MKRKAKRKASTQSATKTRRKTNDSTIFQQLKAFEKENKDLRKQIEEAHAEQCRFINLLVTSQRLSTSLDVREILHIINEIVINLIGSEQFGLYFVKGPEVQEPLELVCEVFQPGALHKPPKVDSSELSEALKMTKVKTYETNSANGSSDGPVAIIPLCMGKEKLGALVLYSVLQHKKGFTKVDLDLFDLLASAAARAFYTAMMHTKSGLPKDLPTLLKQALMVDNRF